MTWCYYLSLVLIDYIEEDVIIIFIVIASTQQETYIICNHHINKEEHNVITELFGENLFLTEQQLLILSRPLSNSKGRRKKDGQIIVKYTFVLVTPAS